MRRCNLHGYEEEDEDGGWVRYDDHQAALFEEIRRADRLQDRYNREVLGLNNEGDPIGGDPPCGLKHRVEQLQNRDRELTRALAAMLSIADASQDANDLVPLIAELDFIRPLIEPPKDDRMACSGG